MGHTLFLPLCGLSHLFLTQTSGIGTVLSHFIDEKTETIKITYLNQINEIQTQGSLTPGPMLNHHAVMPLGPGYILMPKKSLEHMYVYECFERLQNLVVNQIEQILCSYYCESYLARFWKKEKGFWSSRRIKTHSHKGRLIPGNIQEPLGDRDSRWLLQKCRNQ